MVVPSRVDDLANGLACITNTLCAVGLGPVNLGRLAKHMLKLSASVCDDCGHYWRRGAKRCYLCGGGPAVRHNSPINTNSSDA